MFFNVHSNEGASLSFFKLKVKSGNRRNSVKWKRRVAWRQISNFNNSCSVERVINMLNYTTHLCNPEGVSTTTLPEDAGRKLLTEINWNTLKTERLHLQLCHMIFSDLAYFWLDLLFAKNKYICLRLENFSATLTELSTLCFTTSTELYNFQTRNIQPRSRVAPDLCCAIWHTCEMVTLLLKCASRGPSPVITQQPVVFLYF